MARRKGLKIGIGIVVLLGLLGGTAVYGYSIYRDRREAGYLARANDLYNQGNWLLARRTYALYLSQNPDDVEVLAKYADACLHISANRDEALGEAARAYILITQRQPDNVDAQNKLLDLQIKKGSWGDVEYYVESFLKHNPDDPKLLNLRAKALFRMGRRDEAADALRALVDKGVAEPRAYYQLAMLLHERQLESQAQEVLDKGLQQHPDAPGIRAQRAQYALATNNIPSAESEVAEALRLGPQDPDSLLAAMRLDMVRKQWDKAAAYGEQVVKLAPDKTEVYIPLAEVYSQQGQTNKAIDFLANLDPEILMDNPSVLVTLTDLQLTANRREDAEASNRKLMQAHPGDIILQDYFRGRLLLLDGKTQDAVNLLETIVVRSPSFAPAHVYLGIAYIEAGKPEQARTTLENYLRNFPDDENAKALVHRLTNPPRTSEDFAKETRSVTENDLASSSGLITAAKSLYDAAAREGKVAEYMGVIRAALDKAIARDPKAPQGHLALLDTLVASGDHVGAEAALGQAIAAGVPERDLGLAKVGLALARNDVAAARIVYEADVARSDATAKDLVAWASFLAGNKHADLALDLLAKGKVGLGLEDQRVLSITRVNVMARQGDVDGAYTLYRQLATAGGGGLSDSAIQIAQALLRSSAADARDKARTLVDEVRTADPDNVPARLLAAQLHMLQSPPDPAAARELFEGVLTKEPDNVGALLGLSRLALDARDYAKGHDYAERASTASPEAVQPRMQLAEAALGLKQYADAQRLLESITASDTKNLGALELLMNTYLESGQAPKAKAIFDTLRAAAGNSPEVSQSLARIEGRLLLAEGDTGQAEKTLREQFVAHPDDAAIAGNLATALAKAGRATEGEKVLSDFTAAHARDLNGWLTLADYYLADGTSDSLGKASTTLTRAMIIDPNSSSILEKMIDVQARRGRLAEAQALCDRFLEKHPDDATVLFRKASVIAQSGANLPIALQTIERAVQIDPKAHYVALRGLIYIALKQYDKGVSDLQPIAQMGKSTAQVDAALAEAYAELGDRAAAARHYDDAIKKSANDATADPAYLKRIAELVGK